MKLPDIFNSKRDTCYDDVATYMSHTSTKKAIGYRIHTIATHRKFDMYK